MKAGIATSKDRTAKISCKERAMVGAWEREIARSWEPGCWKRDAELV